MTTNHRCMTTTTYRSHTSTPAATFSHNNNNNNNKSVQSNLGTEPRRCESKFPLVTVVRPKFAPKSTSSGGPIRKPYYLPHPWTRPTYDAKRHPDPLRRFSTMHRTDRQTDRPTDRSRESLMTMGRYASNESDAA